MSLSRFVHMLGRGPSKARHMTRDEAGEAIGLILDGQAAPEAVGALLMLMRYRGETADEIAGFVDAIRARVSGWDALPVALDWPSYAAGRSRGRPWFLLSVKLVARAGHRVLIHGWNSHQNPVASVREALPEIGIDRCVTSDQAAREIASEGIVYVPVEAFHAELLPLLKLRDVLGLRSPINTALRALNPAQAAATVQGVFHPSYRALQQDTAALLGQENLTVIKGGGGEFECNPSKDTALFCLNGGQLGEETIEATQEGPKRLRDGSMARGLGALWAGHEHDPFASAIVVGTAALALRTVEPTLTLHDAQQLAQKLWLERNQARAA